MLRRVTPGGSARAGPPSALGPVFWASEAPAAELVAAGALRGVVPLRSMDAQTRADVERLTGAGVADGFMPPCDEVGEEYGTLKCEACGGGCELYASHGNEGLGLAN